MIIMIIIITTINYLWRTGMLMWMGGVPGLARKSPLRCVMLTKVESAVASYTCCCNKKSSVLTLLSTSLLT